MPAFACVSPERSDRNKKPIEVIMTPRSGVGLQSANGRYWARTSDQTCANASDQPYTLTLGMS